VEVVVQGATTALTVVGGVVFSFSCAVLIEELLLGGLFRLFFAPRPVAGQKRSSERVK
jgi:hypothetical protein